MWYSAHTRILWGAQQQESFNRLFSMCLTLWCYSWGFWQKSIVKQFVGITWINTFSLFRPQTLTQSSKDLVLPFMGYCVESVWHKWLISFLKCIQTKLTCTAAKASHILGYNECSVVIIVQVVKSSFDIILALRFLCYHHWCTPWFTCCYNQLVLGDSHSWCLIFASANVMHTYLNRAGFCPLFLTVQSCLERFTLQQVWTGEMITGIGNFQHTVHNMQ